MSRKDLWIAVPTYWSYPSGESGEETTVFDHPTPLDEEGTLARTLESFTGLGGRFKVLVVAAAAHPGLAERVHERVSDLIRPFADRLNVFLASPRHLGELNAMLPEPVLSLESYGSIRNVQLFVPYVLGADAVAGIDDDEIVTDADYVEKVSGYIGERRGGEAVGGLAGPYFDRDGQWRISDAQELASCENIFIKKNFFMNAAIEKAMGGAGADGLVRSNVAFGGNMAVSRETIARTPHDPYIPRGEDYDYVINAAMDGIFWHFCPGLGIIHLPPDSTGSQAGDKVGKLIADIHRFIYMREKMRLHRERFPGEAIDPEYLSPYPGPYLDEAVDLKAHGVRALDEKYPGFRDSTSPEELVEEAQALAVRKAEEFFRYREQWRAALAAVSQTDETGRLIELLRVKPA